MSIVEVAKEAGVSIATISRVINGHGQIRPETKKAVLEAIRRTGYVVPSEEKRFRRGKKKELQEKTRKIGFLVPDVKDDAMHTALTGRLLTGITRELQANGIETIFTKLSSPDIVPENINPGKVDGLIVKNWVSNDNLRKSLDEIPHVVCLETKVPEKIADQVFPDTVQIARFSFDHLKSRGRKRLAVLTEGEQYPQQFRASTFSSLAREEGIEAREICLDSESEDFRTAVKNLFSGNKVPDGLFISACDSFTMQICISLIKSGIELGRDIDIVAICDDPNLSASLDRKISTLDLQTEEMGRAAVQTILWRLQNPAGPQRRLQIAPKFIEQR